MKGLERLHPRSLKQLSHHLQGLIRGRLWLKVLVGLVLGIATGLLLGPTVGLVEPATAATVGNWLALPAQLFLGIVHMIVVPLVVASVIRGIAATKSVEQLGEVGFRTALFFAVTTLVATAIGVGVAYLVRPGDLLVSREALAGVFPAGATLESMPRSPQLVELPRVLIGLLPHNPLGAMVSDEMLGVVVFSVMAGVAMVSMEASQAKPMLDLLGSLQEICMTLVHWAMVLAPVAVFGSLARLTARLGVDALAGISAYVGAVLGGLLVLLVFYLAVALAAGWGPWRFLGAVGEVALLAFSTSSSATVMPVSMRAAEERLGVRPSISQFVIPLGATVNMNGTALYQAVAAVFLAQVFAVELTLASLLLVVVTAVGASVGSAATPGVGIVVLAMVLDSVGIPASGIALILGVDRILDMSRTAVNVTGDLLATLVLDRWIAHPTSVDEEAEHEEELEEQREETGEDTIVADQT